MTSADMIKTQTPEVFRFTPAPFDLLWSEPEIAEIFCRSDFTKT